MVVHIDKLIRHLKTQIEVADDLQSDFVYITKREAEACLELAEAQDVIQDSFGEAKKKRDEKDMLRVMFNRCRAVGSGEGSLCVFCGMRKECEELHNI